MIPGEGLSGYGTGTRTGLATIQTPGGECIRFKDQEGNSETFRYDREGRMTLHVDRNGNRVRTSYNVDGNPVLERACDANGENEVSRS